MKPIFSILITSLLLGGCVPQNQPIPVGTYVTEKGDEKITVTPSKFVFRLKVSRADPDHLIEGEYDYTVLPRGGIKLFPISENQAFDVYGKFEWYWEANKIVLKNRKTGENIRFERKENTVGPERGKTVESRRSKRE